MAPAAAHARNYRRNPIDRQIIRHLHAAGLTQVKIAAAMGVSQPRISQVLAAQKRQAEKMENLGSDTATSGTNRGNVAR